MKNALKFTGTLLAALLYSFAVSIAVNTAGPSQAVYAIHGQTATGEYFSKISLNVSEHTPQSSLSTTVAKTSVPQNFKIPFNGLFVSAADAAMTVLHPFSQYVKSFGNFTVVFGSIDIIYPFHSFW